MADVRPLQVVLEDDHEVLFDSTFWLNSSIFFFPVRNFVFMLLTFSFADRLSTFD
jgi:hypothetical protein